MLPYLVSKCLLALLFRRNAKIGFFHYVLFVFLLFGLLTTAVSLVILIGGAIQEELVFRGMIFRKLERSFGSWIALAGSSILFGLIHLANPNATLVSTIALMVSAGVLFAAIYILTRSPWWTIGVHLGTHTERKISRQSALCGQTFGTKRPNMKYCPQS